MAGGIPAPKSAEYVARKAKQNPQVFEVLDNGKHRKVKAHDGGSLPLPRGDKPLSWGVWKQAIKFFASYGIPLIILGILLWIVLF
jgi:hypothetical protein